MARLTEEMVIARSKQSDLSSVKKLNCWGAELGDVSLLRRMPNVEVLAFSINKIRTLEDFTGCRRLRELYVRKNEIRDLSEIRHLRHLQHLTSLWLDENPCTHHPQYRMTVLRNLPNLEKLDNVPVQPDEVQEAMRRGSFIPDSDDEGYSQQETSGPSGSGSVVRSADTSPDRECCRSNNTHNSHTAYQSQCPLSLPRRGPHLSASLQGGGRGESPEPDERYEHAAMTRSHYEARSTEETPSLRHSYSAQSVKEYSYTNGEGRYHSSGNSVVGGGISSPPHQYHDPYYERSDRSESYHQVPQRASEWERDRERDGGGVRERDGAYPSAVMAERRGFTRRPVTRNSNLLSAVLCLVKELDYPSLEVAEMAVRCRMDELANSQ